MTSPQVSVITVTRNRARLLREAIASVRRQTFPDWEHVIVDDGSTDGTTAAVRELQQEEPRLRYVRQGRLGVGRARNRGVAAARGRFVAFLDDDDLWLPEKLARQARHLEEHPEIGLVYCRADVMDAQGRWRRTVPERLRTTYGELFDECFLQISSVMVRRECLEAAGPFNERLEASHDYELWLRLARGRRLGAVPEALVVYREHPNRMSEDLERRYRMHLTILRAVSTAPSLGVTGSRKARRLAIEAYRLARCYRQRAAYGAAAGSFAAAICYAPKIGLWVRRPRPRGWTWAAQLGKPYAAVLYCGGRSLAVWLQGRTWRHQATRTAGGHA